MSEAISVPLPSRWLDQRIRIAVVGVGGTGSQVLDQLASLNAVLVALGHPGLAVTAFDPDIVSESNIGRQRFCRPDIGRPKSDVLIHRINLFHGLDWESQPILFPDSFYFDLVFGCSDTVAARETIFSSRSLWWIDCGNNARSGHVILGRLPNRHESGFRLPTWCDLFPGVDDPPDAPSCSVEEAISRQSWPVNHRAAQIACELLYCWIRNGSLSWHGAFFEVDPPSISVLPIKPETWWPFGLEVSPRALMPLPNALRSGSLKS